jgi:purine-binding chemotaxis protein CheW
MTEAAIDNQFLTFVMNAENYAIPIARVREVLSVPKITGIPRMPAFMRGVINLRGSVVPVIDLRQKFGLGSTEQTPDTAIVVIDIPGDDEDSGLIRFGIMSDQVKKVVTIASESIEPAPKIGMSINTAFIAGIGKIDDDFTVILNIGEVLTRKELNEAKEVSEPAAAVT